MESVIGVPAAEVIAEFTILTHAWFSGASKIRSIAEATGAKCKNGDGAGCDERTRRRICFQLERILVNY